MGILVNALNSALVIPRHESFSVRTTCTNTADMTAGRTIGSGIHVPHFRLPAPFDRVSL